MNPACSIEIVLWESAAPELLAVRHPVFVHEQGVAAEREVDEFDPVSLHFLARDAHGAPIGTARLLPDGRIGRVAVLRSWRRKGVGRALMEAALSGARERGDQRVTLHAQTHSLSFYESLGFVALGDEFEEEGIPHREMILEWDAD
jgi:predicted GNAT family N-acyltransferase